MACRTLAGEGDSQDSQELLVQHIIEHGVGVRTNFPTPNEEPLYRPGKSSAIHQAKAKAFSTSLVGAKKLLKSAREQPRNASNASVESDFIPNPLKQLHQLRPNPHASTASHSSPRSLVFEPTKRTLVPVQPIANDVATEVGQPSLPESPPPNPQSALEKETREMSSDSPTQSNDGRSYEQYADDNSQLQSSSQASNPNEHRTLHEHDTGFLNFKRSHYGITDSISEDVEVNLGHDIYGQSLPKTQAPPDMGGLDAIAPETPAIGQRLFQHAGNESQIIPPSQLFGQTQWTSAVKKASPTSSRPSPDVFNQNTISPYPASSPLKNRGLRTSPTQAFTSSPGGAGFSSRPSDENGHDEGINAGSVAETPVPRFEAFKKRKTVLEPIGEYKSFRKQSSEREATKSPDRSDGAHDSDSEADEVAFRRRSARLKKERASKTFPSISLPRSSSDKHDNVEVPSTNRNKSTRRRESNDSEQYVAQCYGKTATDNDASQETVADSQEIPPAAPRIEATPKASDSNETNINDAEDNAAIELPKSRTSENVEYRETIPETSPPRTSIEPPKLFGDIMRQESSIRSEAEVVSFPALSSGTALEQQLREPDEPHASSLPEPLQSLPPNAKPQSNRVRPSLGSSPSLGLASSPQSAIRRSARLGTIVTPQSTGRISVPSDPVTITSTLTSLSATPTLSSSITPNTEPGHVLGHNKSRSTSPAIAAIQRRGRVTSSLPGPSSSLPQIRTYSRSRESTKRQTRHSSVSTDELAKPSSSLPESEARKAAIRKPARQSMANQNVRRESSIKHGIFEGMVFALSFQDKPARKNKEKQTDKASIERMIRQGGGKILDDSFEALFKFDSFQTTSSSTATHALSSSLTPLDQNTGFTALITDGHSRKVKYMQALALGLPCLAPRWITTCVSKKEIVDWSSYLLCAGQSKLLGEAIRSRNLQPYDASEVKLVDVIDMRPKLLNEARILLVMKKTKSEKRLPYVFLAQVLGGSLVRVYSLQEARARLRDEEAGGQPFDWVYVDDDLNEAQNALFGSNKTMSMGGATSKKRKRQSAGIDETDRPPKRIRTLNDQLVIESLILGRLIEDGEMDE
ncbi:hypothetical protein M426DRAFT_324738 [Hypoxylon sp. CI-4A]|nr:hypothetical protein M426DRAFT_324738 [Hypoxylon sp. CI-4A]